MGLFGNLFAKKKQPTLLEDLATATDWITEALCFSGYQADHTLESLKEIDRFFDEQTGSGGLLSQQRGKRLFGLGAYIGDVLIRSYGGHWLTDDRDPQGEINAAVELDSGCVVWPIQRAIKRYQNGAEDGIYIYGIAIGSQQGERHGPATGEM